MENVNQPIKVEYKAQVSQQTGVDWTNVKLTLSTGNPNKNNVLPPLSPWYVDFQYAGNYNVRGARVDGYMQIQDKNEEQLLDEVVIADGKQPAKMRQTTAVMVSKVTNVEYEISNPYTIKSSNLTEEVAVRSIEVDAFYEYRANTKIDETAYLVAKMFDWQNFNLLNGNAKLFNQGTFVGETFLNVESTLDTLVLSLGRDENIIINRERLVDMNGTQMLGSNKKHTRYWKISVRNNKKESIRLVLTDQIPVTRQKDITIKLEEADLAQQNETNGYLVWQLDVDSGKSTEVKFGYSIKHPKDQEITFFD